MEQLNRSRITAIPTQRDPLGQLLFALAVIMLALAPTQLLVSLRGMPLAPSEVVLLIAALTWAVRWVLMRDTRSLPPVTHWLLVIAGAASGIGLLTDPQLFPDARMAFALDLAKMVLYLLVFYTVFRAVFTTPQRVRTAVTVLLASTTLAVGFAVIQRVLLERSYQPDPVQRHAFMLADERDAAPVDTEKVMMVESRYTPAPYTTVETPVQVSSTFGSWDSHGYHASRTAYAGFLALVLPFALALLAAARRKAGVAIWVGLLLIGAAISVLAGYIMPALLLGLLVTGFALSARLGWFVLAGIAAYLGVLSLVGGHNGQQILREPFRLTVSADEAAFRYFDEEHGTATRHLKKFWGEQQAALNLLRSDPRNFPPEDSSLTLRNPLFGVGLGQYQGKINLSFGTLGPVSDQRLEPDAQNGYLLQAVNAGLFGLAALLALFGAAIGQAWRLLRAGHSGPWPAALLGATVALTLMTLCMNTFIRGNMVVIVALLAMLNGLTPRPEHQQNNEERGT